MYRDHRFDNCVNSLSFLICLNGPFNTVCTPKMLNTYTQQLHWSTCQMQTRGRIRHNHSSRMCSPTRRCRAPPSCSVCIFHHGPPIRQPHRWSPWRCGQKNVDINICLPCVIFFNTEKATIVTGCIYRSKMFHCSQFGKVSTITSSIRL